MFVCFESVLSDNHYSVTTVSADCAESKIIRFGNVNRLESIWSDQSIRIDFLVTRIPQVKCPSHLTRVDACGYEDRK